MVSTAHPKVFKCPVHEYISVPRDIVTAFIDTPIFQRLRRIEQTSMRPLYPSAHHDRFSHSLGVYHLASIAFHHIEKNTKPRLLSKINLNIYRWTFCIAALMHDCAHAPFSHSFEEYYQHSNHARDFLFSQVDKEFKDDYCLREDIGASPSAHEVFSAAIFLKHFNVECNKLKIRPSLVARMITGTIYSNVSNTKRQLENCLIKLINGPAIDIDKLDYIIRDTWASGICNVNIDTPRLLSALCIDKYDNHLVPSFNKSALSVIQNVVEGRNFLYQWIYSHHTVCYFEYLLKEAGKKLFSVIDKTKKREVFIGTLFSKDVFEKPITSCNIKLYLPCDGDLMFLMKQNYKEIPEINELLSRKPKLIPLWKTQAEFNCIFKTKPTSQQRDIIYNRYRQILATVITNQKDLDSILRLRAKPNLIDIDENSVYISIMGEVKPFTSLFIDHLKPSIEDNAFYYIFIPRECETLKKSCIAAIRSAIAY